MTVQSRAQILDLISSVLADNATKDISEADVRAVNANIADSAVFPADLAAGTITPAPGNLDLSSLGATSEFDLVAQIQASDLATRTEAALGLFAGFPEETRNAVLAALGALPVALPDGNIVVGNAANEGIYEDATQTAVRLLGTYSVSSATISGPEALIYDPLVLRYWREIGGNVTFTASNVFPPEAGAWVLDTVQNATGGWTVTFDSADFVTDEGYDLTADDTIGATTTYTLMARPDDGKIAVRKW